VNEQIDEEQHVVMRWKMEGKSDIQKKEMHHIPYVVKTSVILPSEHGDEEVGTLHLEERETAFDLALLLP
jgi:hypothetical protein